MADNSRVTTISTDKGPDDSGVGAMLFNQFEEERKTKAAEAHTDVIEGIRSKYRSAELDKTHLLNESMARLRHSLGIEASQVQYNREQALRQQALQGTLGLAAESAQQGIPQPGLVQDVGEQGAGMPNLQPRTDLQPGAVDVARDLFGKNIAQHAERERERGRLDAAVTQSRLLKELDAIEEPEAVQAAQIITSLRSRGNDVLALAFQPFTKVGSQSKTKFQELLSRSLPAMELADQRAKSQMAVAKEVTARNLNTATIRAEAQKLISQQRLDRDQIFKVMDKVNTELSGWKNISARADADFYTAQSEAERKEILATKANASQHMAELVTILDQLRMKAQGEYAPDVPATPVPGPKPAGGIRNEFEEWKRRKGTPRG